MLFTYLIALDRQWIIKFVGRCHVDCLKTGALTKSSIWAIECFAWILINFLLFWFIRNFNGTHWTIINPHKIHMGQRNHVLWLESIPIIIILLTKTRGQWKFTWNTARRTQLQLIFNHSKYVINLIKVLLNPYYSEFRSKIKSIQSRQLSQLVSWTIKKKKTWTCRRDSFFANATNLFIWKYSVDLADFWPIKWKIFGSAHFLCKCSL